MLKKLFANKILLLVIAAILVGGGYYTYQYFKGTNSSQVQYITTKVTRGNLVVTVSGSGQVSASNQTNIQAQTSGGVISSILVQDNQKVSTGQVLIRLDPTNDERALRNARASLENAQLQLQSLEQPATTSTRLQAEAAVAQAQQSYENSVNNLATDYNNAYTDIANTFIDLPSAISGLNNVLYSSSLNKAQANVDAYTNLIRLDYPTLSTQFHDDAVSSYQTALTAYNQNLADYKNTNIYSSTSTIESLLNETYGALKAISVANNNAKNLLDLVNTDYTQTQLKNPPAQLTTDETNMQSYLTTTNNHLSTITQVLNSLQSDRQSIVTSNLSIGQTQAALDQLENGPTALQIQMQQLAVTQAQNALTDAEQNLGYDSIRAPFGGIITNITAKIGQPASGALATLVSDTQLAQASLNEVDAVNVKVGQKATITFDALPNITISGTVSEVDTIGTVTQGVVSYNTQVALDVPNSEVKPGMSDNVSIITNVRQNTLMVPNSAVTTKQGMSTVQVLGASGMPQTVQVVTGLSNDTMTEILSGLNEGNSVVTQTKTTTGSTATPNQPSGGGGIRIPGLGGGRLGG